MSDERTTETKEEVERLKAELAKSEEHNAALCERMQDLNSEVFTASCTNARLHSLFSNSEQDYARLKAEVERLKVTSGIDQRTIQGLQQTPEWSEITRLTAYCRKLEAEVERLTKAGDEVIREWSSGDEKAAKNFMKALVIWNAAKEGKPQS